MRKVDCKELKRAGLEHLKEQIEGKNVTLKVIQVEGDSASDLYVRNKKNAALEVGIDFEHILLPQTIKTEELLDIIEIYNQDDNVNGIMVQLPIPKHLDTDRIINKIDPKKDVDGLTDANLGRIVNKKECLRPCTAQGVLHIIDECIGLENIKGKNAVIIGRTALVGLPLIHMLLEYNVTPTICHTKTENMEDYIKQADILITAAGAKEPFISKDMVKDNAIVVDVSTTRGEDGNFHGDVQKEVEEKAGYVTPVPGGVGQLTVLELMNNTYKAYELQNSKQMDKPKVLTRK